MIPPDLALALLINRAADAFRSDPPAYMTYTERMHVTVPSLGRSQDVDRSIAVRLADDYAVMKDLPNGSERTGQAFPVTAYFDPFSSFSFGYFANLKRLDILLQPGKVWQVPTPAPDPSVDAVVAYFSFFVPRYAPDSTDAAAHFLIDPTSRIKGIYPSDVVEDPQTHLPSHVELRDTGTDMALALDFKVVDGHWVIVHGTYSQTQHAVFMTFKVMADVTYDDIAFPSQAPDARLAGTPAPSAAPSPSPAPSPSASPGPGVKSAAGRELGNVKRS